MKDQAVAQNESLQSDEFVIFVFLTSFLKKRRSLFTFFLEGGGGGQRVGKLII